MRPQIVKNIKTLAATFLCLMMTSIIVGQSEATKAGPPAPNLNRTPPELSLPIDSGLIFLLIAGLGYGVYITAKKRKAKNSFL
jgi:hypothetical protein